jgi:hypothetical protein
MADGGGPGMLRHILMGISKEIKVGEKCVFNNLIPGKRWMRW